MNAKKTTYILTALLIAAIAGLLIWATAAENPDTVSPPPASGSGAESRPSAESGASSDSLPPDASSRPDVSETPSETSEDAEEAYAQRVGKSYRIDMTPYLAYVTASDEEYLRLVNQTHLLPSNYVPEDLTDSIHTRKDGRDTQQLRLYAAKALEAFLAEAAEYGHTDVTVTSAYRSYAYQNYLFNVYCDNERKAHPDASDAEIEAIVLTYSLKPGMSEHQSGLCCDILNRDYATREYMTQDFKYTPEAQWMKENCAQFGLILRYTEDGEAATGIKFEPWHFRYVGREAAGYLSSTGMSLEAFTEEWQAALADFEARGGDVKAQLAYEESTKNAPPASYVLDETGEDGDAEISLVF